MISRYTKLFQSGIVIDGRFATSFCRTIYSTYLSHLMILTFWWHYCSYQTSRDTQTRPSANRATWQVMCKHILARAIP